MRSFQPPQTEPNAQLRALYQSLLGHADRYAEFKDLLARYPGDPTASDQAETASAVRDQLNTRLREWIGPDFEGLSCPQVLLWRSIVVEERFSAAPLWDDPN